MINLAALLVTAFWLAGALVTRRAPDPRTARRTATVVATIAVATAIAAQWLPGRGPVLLVISIAGLLAVAVAPAATHPPSAIGRTMGLLATSTLSLAITNDFVAIALWALSAWLMYSAVRRTPQGPRFLGHHAVSALSFAVGTALVTLDIPLGGLLVLVGVAVRLPLFPLHLWFPSFVSTTPMALVVAFGTTPIAVLSHLEPPGLAVTIGALSALIAALFAATQRNGHQATAYLLMSHAGLVTAGHQSDGPSLWLATTLAGAGLAMTTAATHARRGTLSYTEPLGNLAHTPKLAVSHLVFGLALIGFPLLAAFAPDHLLIEQSLTHADYMWLPLITTIAINGITVLRSFLALFAGTPTPTGERDLTPLENYAITTALTLVTTVGLVPTLLGTPL